MPATPSTPPRSATELGWQPRHGFEDGLRQTVRWYLDKRGWWERVMSGAYRGEAPAGWAEREPWAGVGG